MNSGISKENTGGRNNVSGCQGLTLGSLTAIVIQPVPLVRMNSGISKANTGGRNNVSGCQGLTLFVCVSYRFTVFPNTKT